MEDLYKQIGLVSVILVSIYFFYKVLQINTSIMEGFVSKKSKKAASKNHVSEIRESMKKKTEQLKDTLLISKYKTDYEDIIIELEDYLNLSMLQAINILSSTSKESLGKDDIELINNINSVNKFKNTLNGVMKFIDKQ